jgi:hypothetical protein
VSRSTGSMIPRSVMMARIRLAGVTSKAGETISIPIRITQQTDKPVNNLSLSINRAKTHFQCAVGAPVSVQLDGAAGTVPLKVPTTFRPGVYEILIADAWTSETRKGLPGPCTRLIQVTVE